MKQLLIFLILMLPMVGFSQIQFHQLERADTADRFVLSKGGSPYWPEYKTVDEVKTILGMPSGGVYTDDQTIDAFSLSGTTLSLSIENDGQAAQTVDFTGWDTNAADDFSGSWNDLTNIPADIADGDDDTQLTQEQVQDFAGGLATGGTQTLVNFTYNDVANAYDIVVNDDLSLYDNTTSGFISNYQNLTASSGADIENGSITLSDGGGTLQFATETFTTGPGPFTLSNTPTFIIMMLRNGVDQDVTVDYSVTGTDVSLTESYKTGEVIKITYVY